MLIDIDFAPSNRKLRQFGLVCWFALPTVAWMWGATPSHIGAMAGIGAVIAGLGFAFPKTLWPSYIALTIVAAPIGLVVGEIVLLAVFVLVFAPLGLLFRLIGRDPLQISRHPSGDTYWHQKKQPQSPRSYFRQF